jgi:hypothetical protein
MFYVGQKVERWKDIEGPVPPGHSTPPKYVELTVSFVGINHLYEELIDTIEYPHPESYNYYRGYSAEYFRPLTSRPTSISIFTAMLNPKVKEDA